MSSIRQIQIQKCERCHSNDSTTYCPDCEPYHFFCNRCDSVTHSLSIKAHHQRKNINLRTETHQITSNQNIIRPITQSPFSQNSTTYELLNSNTKSPYLNAASNSMNYKNNIYIPSSSHEMNQNDINIMSSSNYNQIQSNSNPAIESLTFSREYINELKQLHNKEKSELQYKINSLQSNLDRLKLTFQSQIQRMQNDMNISSAQNKADSDTMIQKHNEIILEKTNQINTLISQNENLSEENKQLQSQLQQFQLNELSLQNKYELQIQQLNAEIEKLKNVNNELRNNNADQIQTIVKNNTSQIEQLNTMHKKELETLTYETKFQISKINKQLNEYIEQINALNNENNKLKLDLAEVDNKNATYLHEISQLRNICE